MITHEIRCYSPNSIDVNVVVNGVPFLFQISNAWGETSWTAEVQDPALENEDVKSVLGYFAALVRVRNVAHQYGFAIYA